ncbi:MAG: MFS transporter [Paracoccaceae bacterium]|nr:MFS transporter [Paracoccaceae bacterium]
MQLLVGPLADQRGRKPTLTSGLAVFLARTFLCSVASDDTAWLAGRIIQGPGTAAGIVVSRATIRDSFDGAEPAKILAAVTIVFALVSGQNPLLGGIINQSLVWRATFWITGALGLPRLAIVVPWLPETLATQRRVSPASEIAGYSAAADCLTSTLDATKPFCSNERGSNKRRSKRDARITANTPHNQSNKMSHTLTQFRRPWF